MNSELKKITLENQTIETFDIPTMYKMTDEEYREFLSKPGFDGLMFVDHHDNLRSFVGDYPLATTLEQFDILMEEMKKFRSQMVPRD